MEDWYNAKNFIDYKGKPRGLLVLSERHYIHVVEPFKQVLVNGEEKHEPIEYFDILMASIALMGNPDHTPQEFEIISVTPDVLTLKVYIS
jgi:hypothetical protein